MITGAMRWFQPARVSTRSRRSSSAQADAAGGRWGAWSRGRCRSWRSFSRDLRLASSITSSSVGILKRAVELLAALGHRLDRAELLDLGQREVARPEAVGRHAVDHLDAAPVVELRQAGDVGGGDQVGLVARDQVAVLGGDQIGLDVVGAQLDAQRIGLQRVLGQVAVAAAAVADDQRLRFVVVEVMRRASRGPASTCSRTTAR